jgi:hypothetical protein
MAAPCDKSQTGGCPIVCRLDAGLALHVAFTVISFQLLVFSNQFSAVSYQLSAFSNQLSVVSFQLSAISCQFLAHAAWGATSKWDAPGTVSSRLFSRSQISQSQI